jgi:hypothetical protein
MCAGVMFIAIWACQKPLRKMTPRLPEGPEPPASAARLPPRLAARPVGERSLVYDVVASLAHAQLVRQCTGQRRGGVGRPREAGAGRLLHLQRHEARRLPQREGRC